MVEKEEKHIENTSPPSKKIKLEHESSNQDSFDDILKEFADMDAEYAFSASEATKTIIYKKNKNGVTEEVVPKENIVRENRKKVFEKLYGRKKLPPVCRFSKGDKVRLPAKKSVFDKGYKANWTDQLFEVAGVFDDGFVCYYSVKDSTGETLKRKYYAEELNLVSKNVVSDPG